jgi:hypothetical protein
MLNSWWPIEPGASISTNLNIRIPMKLNHIAKYIHMSIVGFYENNCCLFWTLGTNISDSIEHGDSIHANQEYDFCSWITDSKEETN